MESSNHFVLQAQSKKYWWEGDGQLSIKTSSNRKAFYRTHNGFFAVEEDRFLLLNEGHYTISIEEQTAVESFCIFFKDGFAGEVKHSLIESADQLLSDPYNSQPSFHFYEKTYPSNRIAAKGWRNAFKT